MSFTASGGNTVTSNTIGASDTVSGALGLIINGVPTSTSFSNTSQSAAATTLAAISYVASATRTLGGSGYITAPTVTFSGGGGSGATATAVLTSGSVSSINITAGGSGYTSAPTVTLSGGGGSGATATSTIGGISSATFSGGVLTITASGTLAIVNTDLTNSTGTSLLQVPSTPNTCGALLNAAVPFSGTALPSNLAQAAINIARNPFMGGYGKAASFIGNITSQSAAFTPYLVVNNAGTLTQYPHDLAYAILYPKGWGGNLTAATGILYPYPSTLDANDTLYFANPSASQTTAFSATSFISMASNGVFNYIHYFCSTSGPYVTGTQGQVASGVAVTSAPCSEPFGNVKGIAADSVGNVWLAVPGIGADNGASPVTTATPATWAATQSSVVQMNASTGTVVTAQTSTQAGVVYSPAAAYSLSVDQLGNLWLGTIANSVSTTYNIFEYTGASAYTSSTVTSASTAVGEGRSGSFVYGMAIDANQNIWGSGYNSTASSQNYIAAVANQSAPASYSLGTNPITPTYTPSLTLTSGGSAPSVAQSTYGITFDVNGVAYETNNLGTAGITPFTPAYSTNTGVCPTCNDLTSLTVGTQIVGATYSTSSSGTVNTGFSSSGNRYPRTDGAGNIWVGDSGAAPATPGALITRITNIGTQGSPNYAVLSILPCNPGGLTTPPATCGTYGSTPRNMEIDSTGTIWVMNTSGGNVVQLFGAAAPSFPLLQAGRAGIMP
jgi:hypothetical protein